MRIPHSDLPAGTLERVIESFVLREGTEYGASDYQLATKCDQVRRQIERGEAWIDFDPETETIDIRPA